MKTMTVLVLMLLIGIGQAAAQDFNVDLYDHFGTPSPAYLAAGQPGFWNMVPPVGPGDPPVPLNDLSNTPTDAAVSFPFSGPAGGWIEAGPATGDDEALLEDGFWAVDIVERLRITGLEDGPYEVIAYGIITDNPAWRTSFLVGDDGVTVGGEWTGDFIEGVTHATFMVDVVDGLLNIDYVSGFFGASGFFSGFQLDYQGVISRENSTWGGVKTLYR